MRRPARNCQSRDQERAAVATHVFPLDHLWLPNRGSLSHSHAIAVTLTFSLTFSLARELAPFGVTVNGISPAYVNTPMVTEQLTEAQRRTLIAQIPVGRFCEPEEFAHVVRFLVSPLAGFITGEIVDLNGGLVMD